MTEQYDGCRTHGEIYEEAVQQAKDAIASWIMVAKELGRPVPPPGKLKIA